MKKVIIYNCIDPYYNIPAGTEGIIKKIDDIGTVHVSIDGNHVGLIPNEDDFEIIEVNE